MIEPNENEFGIEVFYGEAPLWPTDVVLQVFIGNDTSAVSDVMAKNLGNSPADWLERIEGKRSVSFKYEKYNKERAIVMYLNDTNIALLVREALNSTWILCDMENISINEDTRTLVANFVVYITKVVVGRKDIINESED